MTSPSLSTAARCSLVALAVALGASCNAKLTHANKRHAAQDDAAANGGAAAAGGAGGIEDALAGLEVLAPGELATKLYNVFGPNMTRFDDDGREADYLDVNAASFTGAISNDPNNKIAASATPGYFLALAGLSAVVGENYEAAFYAKTARNDCSQDAGALTIVKRIAATITDAEAAGLAAELKAACAARPRDAAKAIVQSLSFVVKAVH
jgi:hypothetical protein